MQFRFVSFFPHTLGCYIFIVKYMQHKIESSYFEVCHASKIKISLPHCSKYLLWIEM